MNFEEINIKRKIGTFYMTLVTRKKFLKFNSETHKVDVHTIRNIGY